MTVPEKSLIHPLIRDYLDKLAERHPWTVDMVATARNEIENQMAWLNFWVKVERAARRRHNHTKEQVAELWVKVISQSTMLTLDGLQIQDLMMQLESPEFDASKRQMVRDELKKAFEEIKTISDGLKQPPPPEKPIDSRLIQ